MTTLPYNIDYHEYVVCGICIALRRGRALPMRLFSLQKTREHHAKFPLMKYPTTLQEASPHRLCLLSLESSSSFE